VRDNAMLREQDRRKDEFLATLAHELRNPLAPIKYAVSMMRLAPEPASNQRAQAVIDRQVSQMSRLIGDLLDLSRINLGLINLQREPVRLRTLVERAVETARPAIESARALPRRRPAAERGPGAHHPGDRQPAEQRGQVHARRRPHRGLRRGARRRRPHRGE
jgi:signal transduction histidine kinase